MFVSITYAQMDMSPSCFTEKGSTERCLGVRYQVENPQMVTRLVSTSYFTLPSLRWTLGI